MPNEKTAHTLPLVETFYSLQGEGIFGGAPACFVRLAGCNVGCAWCDSKSSWDARHFAPVAADEIVRTVLQYPAPMVVVTGGEPLLHNLDELCNLLQRHNLQLHLETSGTQPLSGKWDWICLSPKVQQPPLQAVCSLANECKVVIAGSNDFAWAEQNAARVSPHCRLLLQPEWSRRDEVLPLITEYAKQHPKWRVALQLHKLIDIP